jgi:predicted DCC family thiol-disulfide oxidoreductase YuxK
MKTDDLVIVYDAECPMCQWYTGEFVKTGLLSPNGREAYQKIGAYTKTQIDMKKARNHIALLNKNTGNVVYGYESLLEVLGQKWHWMKTIGATRFVAMFFSVVYDFISYNRKIIAPPKNRFLTCIPDKNPRMRIAFMVLCLLVVEFTAGMYFSRYFGAYTRFAEIPWRESLLFVSQIGFMALFAALVGEKNLYDYLGHLSFVAFMGGIILLVFDIVFQSFSFMGIAISFLPFLGLGAVVMWMFMEHKKRLNAGGFKPILSYGWILFRVLLFFIIFKLQA